MSAVISEPTSITVKFEQRAIQTVEGITRVSGFVSGRHFIGVIDALDLEANPRAARVGRVTNAIIESIQKTPREFPFKSKGVLLGATSHEILDRGRVKATFVERDKEGILDGGHNTMAIGLHLLKIAGVPDSRVRKAKDWASFRGLWTEEADAVKALRRGAQDVDDVATLADELGFLVPVELIVPSDSEDAGVLEAFQVSILEICAARNNNAELVIAGKSNQAGLYDELKKLVPADVSSRIEWKVGEGGAVKVSDLIALSWMPLSMLDPLPQDPGEKPIVPPIPQNLYRNKGECLTKFDALMRLDSVTSEESGRYVLKNAGVRSALEVAADLPRLFDLVEELFPAAYNKADGKYGRIGAVKKMNSSSGPKTANFTGRKIETISPDGFLYPVVYGLRVLMTTNKAGEVEWDVDDPAQFLRDNLDEIALAYKAVVSALDWDPVRIGKAPLAYQVVTTAFQKALASSS